MKAMLSGFALTFLIMFGAYFALQQVGFSSQERTSGQAVRLN